MAEEDDRRTLPERWMAFGDCRAYIAEVDITLGADIPFKFKRIQWTCGFKVDVQAAVPWKAVRPTLRSMHNAYHSKEATDIIPGGDAPPPSVQDAERHRPGTSGDPVLHPTGSGGGQTVDFRRPDPSDTNRGA